MQFFTARFFLLYTFVTILYASTEVTIKVIGDLYFSDNEHIINFYLDLDSYFLNAALIKNNTLILDQKCNKNQNLTSCKFVQTELKLLQDLIEKESYHLKHSRKKRDLLCLMLFSLATIISSTIAAYFTGVAAAKSTQTELVEQHNIEHATTTQQLDYFENQIKLSNKTIHKIFDNLDQLHEEKFISDLTLMTIIAIQKQTLNTEKFIDALSIDLPTNFFTIIDFGTFNNAVRNAQKSSPA